MYLAEADFRSLQGSQAGEGVLHLKGEMELRQSANLVAVPSWAREGEEVLVTAHVDSKGGPGADDNASGFAVSRTSYRLDASALSLADHMNKRLVEIVEESPDYFARRPAKKGVKWIENARPEELFQLQAADLAETTFLSTKTGKRILLNL